MLLASPRQASSNSISRGLRVSSTRSLRGGPRDDIGSLIGQIPEKNALQRRPRVSALGSESSGQAERATTACSLVARVLRRVDNDSSWGQARAIFNFAYFFGVDKREKIREFSSGRDWIYWLRRVAPRIWKCWSDLFTQNTWKVNSAIRWKSWIEFRILSLSLKFYTPRESSSKVQFFFFWMQNAVSRFFFSFCLFPRHLEYHYHLMAVRWLIDKLRRVKISRTEWECYFYRRNSWKFESSRRKARSPRAIHLYGSSLR